MGGDTREEGPIGNSRITMSARVLNAAAVLFLTIGSVRAAGVRELDLNGIARTSGRPELNAVVWLEAPHAPAPVTKQKIVLSQRNETFLPHVLAVRVGTTVEFPNEDRVYHNVFSFHDGKKFDLGTYPVGSLRRLAFSEAGVSRLFCNIHPHMFGYVVALDSPSFVAVNKDGTFTIPGVPPGTYTYHAWRPAGPMLTGMAVLPSGSLLNVTWP